MACFQRPVQQNAGVSVLHVCIASTIREVNKLRYHFCAKRGEVESRQLPACKYCLYMHVLQAKKKKTTKNKQTNKKKTNKRNRQQFGSAALSARLLFQIQRAVDGPQMTMTDWTWMRGSPHPEASAADAVLQVYLFLQTSRLWVPFEQITVHQHMQTADCTNQKEEDEDEVAEGG